MKATELRIGNYVYDKYGRVQEVLSIETECTIEDKAIRYVKYYNIVESIENTNPIPLTEEWLLKFGFKVEDNSWFKNKDLITLERYDNRDWDVFYSNTYEVHLRVINHVHQLQNLYFALTNKELK
jgi:hypothetical protein